MEAMAWGSAFGNQNSWMKKEDTMQNIPTLFSCFVHLAFLLLYLDEIPTNALCLFI